MHRRNFLTALGATAAAGVATIGTGAFTSVSARRDLEVQVADDSAALVKLVAPNSLENGEYATDANEGSTDTLVLNFDADADVAGTGVNDDAVSRFDSVFELVNQGTQFVRFGIDKSGLDHPGRWDFYPYGDAVNAYPNWDEGYVGPGAGPGGGFPVGVRVDTTGSVSSLGGGTLVIKARA
jgi:hypothetical protein